MDLSEEETIEQILSRSEVLLHDAAGKTATATPAPSFSKASFVSAATNDASNTVSMDDPDFWQKVVGLAVRESADAVCAKRKCREAVGSYREPGLTLKDLSAPGTARSNEGGEDDSSVSDGGKGKRATKKSRLAEVPAEWTEANLSRLTAAMAAVGYCRWPEVQSESRLKWSAADTVSISSVLCTVVFT